MVADGGRRWWGLLFACPTCLISPSCRPTRVSLRSDPVSASELSPEDHMHPQNPSLRGVLGCVKPDSGSCNYHMDNSPHVHKGERKFCGRCKIRCSLCLQVDWNHTPSQPNHSPSCRQDWHLGCCHNKRLASIVEAAKSELWQCPQCNSLLTRTPHGVLVVNTLAHPLPPHMHHLCANMQHLLSNVVKAWRVWCDYSQRSQRSGWYCVDHPPIPMWPGWKLKGKTLSQTTAPSVIPSQWQGLDRYLPGPCRYDATTQQGNPSSCLRLFTTPLHAEPAFTITQPPTTTKHHHILMSPHHRPVLHHQPLSTSHQPQAVTMCHSHHQPPCATATICHRQSPPTTTSHLQARSSAHRQPPPQATISHCHLCNCQAPPSTLNHLHRH
jgi:hypothetical protein